MGGCGGVVGEGVGIGWHAGRSRGRKTDGSIDGSGEVGASGCRRDAGAPRVGTSLSSAGGSMDGADEVDALSRLQVGAPRTSWSSPLSCSSICGSGLAPG